MRIGLRAAVVAGLLGAGCRSYSSESVDALYRDVLQYSGREDAAAVPAKDIPAPTPEGQG